MIAIIYIDFVKDIAPLAISLRQQCLAVVIIERRQDDKQVTLENWQTANSCDDLYKQFWHGY